MATDDEKGGRGRTGVLWHAQPAGGYIPTPGAKPEPGEVIPSCACGFSYRRAVPLKEARSIMSAHRRSGSCTYSKPESIPSPTTSDREPVPDPAFEYECEMCGDPFTRRRSIPSGSAITCSDRCRVAAYRARRDTREPALAGPNDRM